MVADQLPVDQIVRRGSETSPEKARPTNGRTSQGDDSLRVDFAAREKTSDAEHVLKADIPDELRAIDRVDEMDVQTHRSSRMRAGEVMGTNVLGVGHLEVAVQAATDVNVSVGQLRESHKTALEIIFSAGDHESEVGCQRLRVPRGHEDRARYKIRLGQSAERTGAQRGPTSGFEEQRAHLIAAQGRWVAIREGGERDSRLVGSAFESDDDRL